MVRVVRDESASTRSGRARLPFVVSLSNQCTSSNYGNTPFDRLRTNGIRFVSRRVSLRPFAASRTLPFVASQPLHVGEELAPDRSRRVSLYTFGARANLCPLGASPHPVRGEPACRSW